MNTFKTFLLMAGLTGIVIVIGELIGGQVGMMYGFVIAIAMNFASYWFSDKIVLAMYGAKPITEADSPELYRIVENLARGANLPMPKLYLIPTETPNAFATGRNPQHAAVAVTEGLMRLLGTDEVEGVLAHELSHIRNRDILISTIAATMAGGLMIAARMAMWGAMLGGYGGRDDENRGSGWAMLIVLFIGAIAAMLIQLAISRSREYLADETGARMTGRPSGLAHALLKLEKGAQMIPMNAQPETAHMFIVNPLAGRSVWSGLGRIMSTHPPISDRVRRLEAMEGRV